MPSDQYSLSITNTTVCSLDRELSRATGRVIGDTNIVLHDKSECRVNVCVCVCVKGSHELKFNNNIKIKKCGDKYLSFHF